MKAESTNIMNIYIKCYNMQVHSSKKACAAVYPSTTQNGIVWFWPNLDPKFKDIIMEKKPPFIPELDDPSYVKLEGNRDMAYG